MRLLVTRPEPDASKQAAALTACGQEAVVSPLITIEYLKPPLALYRDQVLIVTSRNALRAAEQLSQLDALRELPLVAVGEATAKAARDFGYREVIEGPGTAKDMADLIAERFDPHRGRLIHLAGDHLAFDLTGALEPKGFYVETAVLYRSKAAEALTPEAEQRLAQGALDGVILMSPRTAEIFARLARNKGYTLASLYGFCLSTAIAAKLQGLGLSLRVPKAPRQEELLALITTEASSS